VFVRANFFWAIAFEKACLDILIAQLPDFVLRFLRTKGRLSFVSYFFVLLQWSQAPRVQHTHDGGKTNHCAPSHCKKIMVL
jgi:hypothetical protein